MKPIKTIVYILVLLLADHALAQTKAHANKKDLLPGKAQTASTRTLKVVDLALRNMTLLQALEEVAAQFDVGLAINPNLVPGIKVNKDLTSVTLTEALDQLLAETRLEAYLSVAGNIIVRSKEKAPVIQERNVTGKVTDDKGEPLPGVNILIKGSARGTITDMEGNYRINIPGEAVTLVFSFVGYQSQEVNVAGRTSIDIVLREDMQNLEEVVIVGYGTQTRRDLAGSQASVSSKDFEGHPVYNFAQILQGRTAGVVVSNTSGSPGQTPKIRIRGANSISSNNDPLYVVDGFVSDFNNVNVNDIQSIDILKDASATAIYGSRGANGVVLITTKSGQSGETRVTVASNVGFTQLENEYDLLNSAEYAVWVNEHFDQDVFSEADIEGFRQGAGTDWQDAVMQTGLTQNHQVSVSGGREGLRYYVSGNIVDEEGILINTNQRRYTLRTNLSTTIGERMVLDLNINATQRNRRNAQLAFGSSKEDPVWNSIIWSPTEPIFNDDGTYNQDDTYGSLLKNPFMYATESMQDDRQQAVSLNINASYNIFENLSFDVIAGLNQTANETSLFESELIDVSTGAIRNYQDVFDWQLTTMLNYSKTLGEQHQVSILGGYELYENEVSGFSANARNLAVNSVAYHNLSLGESQLANSNYAKWSLMSYFGRVNYNFTDKYYFTGTYRADGSSKFQDDNKFGFFPSLAVGWALSEENFVKDLGIFDNLKLRASWGVTGNQAIDPYATLSVLRFLGYSYTTSTRFPGYGPAIPPNPDLRWEETAQANIGLNMSFLDDRVSLTFDYFQKNTTGLLAEQELPLYAGMGRRASVTQNLGEIENTGFDINLLVSPVRNDKINWDVNFNLSRVRNEVIDIGDQEQISGGSYAGGLLSTSPFVVRPGEPLGTFWGYRFLGIWGTEEAEEARRFGNQPGDAKYEDTSGDGAIGPEDYQVIGDANPDFSWGLNNTFTYKNFEFNLLLEGIHGRDVFNLTYATAASIVNDSRSITLREATNYWTPENQDSPWPNVRNETNVSHMNSSQWIQEGGFVKVRNISVTYNLGRNITKVGDLRLTVSGQNLFTFTNYEGFDPEASSTGNRDIDAGLDFGVYPTPRIFTVGASLQF